MADDDQDWARRAALDYVRLVLERSGLSPSGLAKEAGISSTTLTRALNNPRHKPVLSRTTLDKIRDASQIDYAPFLAKDLNSIERSLDMFRNDDYHLPHTSTEDVLDEAITVMGSVAAGVWREVQYLDDSKLWIVFLAPAKKDLRQHIIGLFVEGESLNKIARDGDVLVVESIAQTGRKPIDDDLVVVERRRHQDGIIEMTAKRLKGGGKELWPESDDPRYQTKLALGDDGVESVQITGVVHYIVRDPHPRD